MSDLQQYINHRKQYDSEFAENFDEGYQIFKLGAVLRQARDASGATKEDITQNAKGNYFNDRRTCRRNDTFNPRKICHCSGEKNRIFIKINKRAVAVGCPYKYVI